MLISPNAVHSPMMTSGLGTSPAIVGGVRKIPLPIVMPTMSAVPPANPMTRRRCCGGDCTEVFKEEPTYSKSRSFAPRDLQQQLLRLRQKGRGEPQTDRTRQREPLGRKCQRAGLPIAREHDDGARALIGDEQPAPAGIEAEITRPVALGRDHLL